MQQNRIFGSNYGSSRDGDRWFNRGGYVRLNPKRLMGERTDMFEVPLGPTTGLVSSYGTPFNTPIPRLHHQVASLSSGHRWISPTPNEQHRVYGGGTMPDGMMWSVQPDFTLTGYNTAGIYPEQLSPLANAPYNQNGYAAMGRV